MAGPNILFIVADDLGWGDLGSVNGGLSDTPHLDALIGESLCLAQHHSSSPVCAPARASLFTGRYPHRTGAIDTLETRGLDRIHLRERTIADLLRDAGYVTGLVGKWHNGALDARYHPNARGFDVFAGFCGGWSDYLDWRLDHNGSLKHSDGRYLTDVLTEEAIGFIQRHHTADEPFFLTVAYNAPHYPLQAQAEDEAHFAELDATPAVRTLYGMVRSMDRGIGRILDALDAFGLVDDTIVVFTSDNGPQLFGAGAESTVRFNCGLAGGKGLVNEGGILLPAIVRWPGGGVAPGRVDTLVHLTDWLPTLLAAVGVPVPKDSLPLDGVDVSPLLHAQPAEVPDQRFWQWNRYEPSVRTNAAARDGSWKLVVPPVWSTLFPTPTDLAADHDLKDHPDLWLAIDASPLGATVIDEAPSPQLFDLAADPGEQNDVAAAHPARVTRMVADLERWFADVDTERRSLTWT